MNAGEFFNRLEREAHLSNREEAEQIAEAVFHTLRDRLTHDEIEDLAAQLPERLREIWQEGPIERVVGAVKGHQRIGWAEFIEHVAEDGGCQPEEADQYSRLVFHLLKEAISAGEVDHVSAQLPQEIESVWRQA